MSDDPSGPDLAAALEGVERHLLGEPPSLTRHQVAERAGVPLELADELWRLLGFPTPADDAAAFTPYDVEALRLTHELIAMGILSPERRAAMTRTWGRSFARLAEWQMGMLTSVALEGGADPAETLPALAEDVLPRLDSLQSYVWRRHLAAAGARAMGSPGGAVADLAVVFVDIVGYTSRSKSLSEVELVEWLEGFEAEASRLAVDRGGRVIKNIGDEVLVVCDEAAAALDLALALTRRGEDDDDPFPRVRAGVAYGEVVNRLGDVFGPTVNVASRLTSVARPGTVVADEGVVGAVTGRSAGDEPDLDDSGSAYRFRRIRRLSVKGYARLRAWSVRAADDA